jgi:hypothetical protein
MTATVNVPRFVEAIRTDRFSLKIGGYSGQGINSIGEVLVKLCKETGWQVFGYREYPSLIIGGYASYQMDISDHPINSSSERVDVLVCLGREALKNYLTDVRPGGLIVHTLPRFVASAEQKAYLEANTIEMVYVPAEDMVRAAGAHRLLTRCDCSSTANASERSEFRSGPGDRASQGTRRAAPRKAERLSHRLRTPWPSALLHGLYEQPTMNDRNAPAAALTPLTPWPRQAIASNSRSSNSSPG